MEPRISAIIKDLQREGIVKWEKKRDTKGRARDRTGIAGIRIQSDNHYTTQPCCWKIVIGWTYKARKQVSLHKAYPSTLEASEMIDGQTYSGVTSLTTVE